MRRVLIVEPDDALRTALLDAVAGSGWQAEGAASLQGSPTDAASWNAILIDVSAADGLEGLARLAGGASTTAVVAMGPADRPGLAVRAAARGARAFLGKPFRIGALEAALTGIHTGPDPAPAVELLTEEPVMARTLRDAEAAAASDATVVILGENGSGRRRLAHFIHGRSHRRDGLLVEVECGALGERATEALFGADTSGAGRGATGQATGGSLLLQEVDELPLEAQPGLLGVMQSPRRREASRPALPRILATARRPLAEVVATGALRQDLCHRLEVIVLRIPPLRERPRDLETMARLLIERAAFAQGAEPPRLTPGALSALRRQSLPGNVRELENLAERAVLLFPGREIDFDALRTGIAPASEAPHNLNLRELERQTVIRSLAIHGGNRTHAARALGISARTLRNKIRDYGLR